MVTVVFDLDGTLADTSADLIAAANHVFRQAGHGDVLDPVADQATAFRGGRAMLTKGYARLDQGHGPKAVEAGYPILLEAYGAALDVHTRLYPGAVAAIDRLAAAGLRVAVCTNKPEGLADRLLTRLGVRDRFGALIGADTLAVRKPDPLPLREAIRLSGGDPAQGVLIGDTVTDRETARAAGLPCVLVTFGPEGRAVADLEPEGLLDHFDDLDQVIAPFLPAHV